MASTTGTQASTANERLRFTLLPDALYDQVAEGAISRDAAWLYTVLLRHHNRKRRDDDVWPSRAVLAKACGLKKPESVDPYLKELQKAGLIRTEARRRKDNMKTSSKHTLLLVVPRSAEESAEIRDQSADTPSTGYRYPLQRGTVTPSTGDELEQGELHQGQRSEEMSPGSFVAGGSQIQEGGNDFTDPWANTNVQLPHQRRTFEDWRRIDRQTFRDHLGAALVSRGTKWREGKFTIDAFYNAFRTKNSKTLEWPGQYIDAIADRNEYGIDDWLIDQGLARPDQGGS